MATRQSALDRSTSGPPGLHERQARAIRRHHRSRMIVHARRSVKFSEMDETDRERFAVLHHDHLTNCSCWMCGDPRKTYREPTIQERRQSARSHDFE